MNTKRTLNLYSISFRIGDIEYGHQLKSIQMHKNVTGAHFVEDKFIFDKTASDLLNMTLSSVSLEISLNKNGSYEKIYKNKGIISKVMHNENGDIILFFETDQKINWMRKNGVSITSEQSTVKEAVEMFVEKVDKFYKHEKPTNLFINYEKNINKHKYENLLFPIKKSNFDTLTQICKTFYIINSPFYIFLDDYHFDKSLAPISLEFYDLSNIKSLRAVLLTDLNTSAYPTLKTINNYYDSNVYFDIEKMQKFNIRSDSYSFLKPFSKLDSENRFKYNVVQDKLDLAQMRQDNSKRFFSKATTYYRYQMRDFDLTKFKIGYRYVDDTSSAKSQYVQAIVDAKIYFYTTGKADVIENKGSTENQFTVATEFTTISN